MAKQREMADVGTRLDHLTDLKDLWENALVILERNNAAFVSEIRTTQIKELKTALALLDNHMLKDYRDDFEMNYRREINLINREG